MTDTKRKDVLELRPVEGGYVARYGGAAIPEILTGDEIWDRLRSPDLAQEVQELRDNLERTQSMLDFLSRDQRPLEVRMAKAEAKARIAERVAAEVVTELRMPIHTRSTPGDWRHSIAAIATGSWEALLPDTEATDD